MKEFTLAKTGGIGTLSVLGEKELSAVLALQEQTRAHLPEDKKNFVLPQETPYFESLLNRSAGLMVGVHTDGALVAQMALKGPLPLREAIASRLITHNDVPFHHASLSDTVVVFKSMASDPVWRGNGLARNLVAFASELPFTRMCDHIFLQISVGNKRSWNVFSEQNFGIVAAAYDPDDGKPRFIFQKPAFGFDFEPQIMADEVDPVADFPAIVSLTQREGLIGVYAEGSVEKLIFLHSREEAERLPLPTIARVS